MRKLFLPDMQDAKPQSSKQSTITENELQKPTISTNNNKRTNSTEKPESVNIRLNV
jgi:hypothetical protein